MGSIKSSEDEVLELLMGECGKRFRKEPNSMPPLHAFGHGTDMYCLEPAPNIGDLSHFRL